MHSILLLENYIRFQILFKKQKKSYDYIFNSWALADDSNRNQLGC